jgi:hypothetical protein
MSKSYQQILDEMVKTIYTTTTGGTLTQDQIEQILKGVTTIGLTAEEEKELEELKAQHAGLIKAAKLSVFKKLPSDMRQFVINNLEWEDRVAEIESATTEKSTRLQELENRDRRVFINNGQSFSGTNWHDANIGNFPIARTIRLPDGLTANDLRQAHVEATLEEEVLHEQKV